MFGVFVADTPRQTAVWKLWTKMEDTTLVSCSTHFFGKALSQMWEWQTLTGDVLPSKKVHADQNSNEKKLITIFIYMRHERGSGLCHTYIPFSLSSVS